MAKIDLDLFEKVVVQNCLKKDSVYLASIIEYLDKSLFKNANIGNTLQIIKDFYIEQNSIPTFTEIRLRATTLELKESLKEVVKIIQNLDDTVYNNDELVKNTEYFIKQRNVANLTTKIVDEKVNSKEFDLDDIQKEWERIHSITLIDNFGLDYFEDNERVEEYLLQKDSLISTGYIGLDDAFGGGFQKEGKAIYDIGGETNIGKSLVLANIAINVILQNLNVVIISPEMSEMRYAKRISGMITGIAVNALGENIEQYKAEIERYKRKITSKLIIKEVPTKGVSAKNVGAYLKKLKDQKGFVPNLICIDGHALLRPSVNQPSKHSELQFIVQECRALSYVHCAPILTVAQLNRGSHKANNPGLDNMAGSWDQLADFDAHVNIWQTDEDREANIIRYGGKKVRDGAKGGEGFLTIDYDCLRLTEDKDSLPHDYSPVGDKSVTQILDFNSFM